MSDLISRQDVIDAIITWDKFGVDERNRLVRWYEGLEPYVKLRDVVWAIEKTPSAEHHKLNIAEYIHDFYPDVWRHAEKELEVQPSTERKGTWIEMGTNKDGTHNIKCSKCGEGYKTRGHARSIATKAKYNFCPNCGARMVSEDA